MGIEFALPLAGSGANLCPLKSNSDHLNRCEDQLPPTECEVCDFLLIKGTQSHTDVRVDSNRVPATGISTCSSLFDSENDSQRGSGGNLPSLDSFFAFRGRVEAERNFRRLSSTVVMR